MRRLSLLAAFSGLLCGLSSPASARTPPLSHWLSWNLRQHSARLLLVAGYDDSNGGFNFDGYARGRRLVRIPRNWLLTVVCENRGAGYHSCAVVHGAQSATIAFHGAATRNPSRGLAPGRSSTFRFRASQVGVYRLVCLVPGHALAREYDVLQITRSGKPAVELLSSSPG